MAKTQDLKIIFNTDFKNLKISKVSNYISIIKPKTINITNGIIIPNKLKNL